jgi:hypothetical protein
MDFENEIMDLINQLEREQSKTKDLLSQLTPNGKFDPNCKGYEELEKKYKILKKKFILTNLELLNFKSK